jgi:8-hydroxy-5-deazaflavin:NADPH oxidoreductase
VVGLNRGGDQRHSPGTQEQLRKGERAMKIGVLGTGMVGQAIATKLSSSGTRSRWVRAEPATRTRSPWAKDAGEAAAEGSFAEAAGHGELVVNCTAGVASLEALEAAGKENLSGKTLIDIAIPLDASQGFPRPRSPSATTRASGSESRRPSPMPAW